MKSVLILSGGLDSSTLLAKLPEGRTIAEVLEHGRQAAEWCKDKGWKLCIRNQILLWGNTRGT